MIIVILAELKEVGIYPGNANSSTFCYYLKVNTTHCSNEAKWDGKVSHRPLFLCSPRETNPRHPVSKTS